MSIRVDGAQLSVGSYEAELRVASYGATNNSIVIPVSVKIDPLAAAPPILSPASGSYDTPQMIAMADATPGATIFYTLDGSVPTASSTVYTGPFLLTAAIGMVKAIASATGFSNSPVAGTSYNIAPIATTTTLTASANDIIAGGAVTFSALVKSNYGIQGGTVSFHAATQELGTATIDSSGNATLSTTTLTIGAQRITANFSGNANYLSSSSDTLTIQVAPKPAADFSISADPASVTVQEGKSATATLTVTALNGWNAAVSFACAGLPAESRCSFSPSTVMPANGTTTAVLTITTTAPTSALVRPSRGVPGSSSKSGLPAILAFVLLCFPAQRSRSVRRSLDALLLLVAGICMSALLACGGGQGTSGSTSGGTSDPGTPAGTSAVQVTASGGAGSGNLFHLATISVVVTK